MQLIILTRRLLILPFIVLIRFYQIFISPFLGQNCRFYPTCSCYAHQALNKHGVVKGSYLSMVRIMKCNPMHEGGIDEVPEPVKKQAEKKHPMNKTNVNPN